jgi:hypothetical protein
MRPSTRLLILVSVIALFQLTLYQSYYWSSRQQQAADQQMKLVIQRLGLTDLCIATDARYIRHLSISDPVAPFMDHPGGIEHFPSSAVIAPVR